MKVLIVWGGGGEGGEGLWKGEGKKKTNAKIASLKVRLFQKSEPANKEGNIEGALPQSRETLLQTSGKSPRLELKEKSGALEG